MTRLSESAVLASKILGTSGIMSPDSREFERQEALDAVLAEFRRELTPDGLAACVLLMGHLSRGKAVVC